MVDEAGSRAVGWRGGGVPCHRSRGRWVGCLHVDGGTRGRGEEEEVLDNVGLVHHETGGADGHTGGGGADGARPHSRCQHHQADDNLES